MLINAATGCVVACINCDTPFAEPVYAKTKWQEVDAEKKNQNITSIRAAVVKHMSGDNAELVKYANKGGKFKVERDEGDKQAKYLTEIEYKDVLELVAKEDAIKDDKTMSDDEKEAAKQVIWLGGGS